MENCNIVDCQNTMSEMNHKKKKQMYYCAAIDYLIFDWIIKA